MYRIGEFSYLCSMSIKTLRYYDKIGVLTPERVDELTGYRYYSIDQLEQAQKIKSLQEASFTLEEIKAILKEKNTEILLSKEKQIRKEELNKIQKINKMKKELNNEEVEVLENPNLYITGDFKKLKSYNNFDEEVEKLNINYHDNNWKKVFVNLEEGYKEENIKCFIGKLISKEDEISYLSSLYNNLKEETLKILAYGTLSPNHAGQFIAFIKQIKNRYRLSSIISGDESWPNKPEDRDVLYFLAQSFRAQIIKELPSDKKKLSENSQYFAHRAKALIKDLSLISLEIAQMVVGNVDENSLPNWFMIEIVRDLPRLVEKKNG